MFAAFPIGLFLIGAIIFIGLPLAFSLQSYFKNRGRRSVICPENHQHVDVEMDRKFAFRTAWRGKEHTRLQSCTRWPEKGDCGQQCLAQVDPTPENIERLLVMWANGRACGICGRLLTTSDWRQGRLALLDERFKLIEMRQIDLTELSSTLERTRPLCWACHQDERARQAPPHRILKGERLPVTTVVTD
jgi:hypothetical protein